MIRQMHELQTTGVTYYGVSDEEPSQANADLIVRLKKVHGFLSFSQ
jgi:hypothetical protein